MGDIVLDGGLQGLFFGLLNKDLPVRAIPCGNLVSPPQLPRDAPRLDILHPLEVSVFPVLRHKIGAAFANRGNRRLRQRLVVHPPLVGQARLDRHAAAVAMRHHMLVRLDLVEQPGLFEDFNDDLARGKAILSFQTIPCAVERSGMAETFEEILVLLDGDRAVDIHDIDGAQAAALADFEIVEVMRGRDLHGARAGGRIGIVIGNDRDLAADDRQDDVLADNALVTLILRVHRNAGIAEHRFRTRRGDDDIIAGLELGGLALLIESDRILIGNALFERVAQVPEIALDLDLLDFHVGNRGQQLRVPVDQTLVLIDQALLVERDENFEYSLGETFIHGEALTRPVAGCAKAFQLVEDQAT
ncbi:hypothetical protein D3C71_811980 [compost metagenome]